LNSIDWNVDEELEEEIFHATPRPTPLRRRDIAGGHKESSESHGGRDRVRQRKQKWKELRKQEKARAATSGEVLGFIGKARAKVADLVGKVFGGEAPKTFREYQEVEREIEQLNSAIGDVRSALYRLDNQLKHDLGPDNVWWPLSEKQFEKSKDGNDYQLTIFDHLMHRQTGSNWYGLCYGTFAGFNATKRTMLYEGGQMCWEGPPRRTEVYLFCGPSNKFLDMEEIDRCIFRGAFETPLVCSEDYLEWVKGMSDLELSEFVTQWEQVG
jgi:hypothetical protein